MSEKHPKNSHAVVLVVALNRDDPRGDSADRLSLLVESGYRLVGGATHIGDGDVLWTLALPHAVASDSGVAAAVAGALEADPHTFSSRPCQTCRLVSGLLGRDFGCVAKKR